MTEKQRIILIWIIVIGIMSCGVALAVSDNGYGVKVLYLCGIFVGIICLGVILEYKPPDDSEGAV